MQDNEAEKHPELFQAAMQALQCDDRKSATTYLTLSIAACPTVPALVEMAKIHFAEKRLDMALSCVTRAKQLCRKRDAELEALALKVETEFLAMRAQRERVIAERDLPIYCIDVDSEKFNSAETSEAKHECITHLGGDGWRLTVDEVIDRIEKNVNQYYVPLAKHSFVRVVAGPNRKYLRAVLSDFGMDYYCDNLFALGTCLDAKQNSESILKVEDAARLNNAEIFNTEKERVLESFQLLETEINNKELPSNLGPPEIITIEHDDYHAEYIGLTANGLQFFITSLFIPGGNEYLAVFLFSKQGDLIESKVDLLGTRDTWDVAAARELRSRRLAELGKIEFGDITIKPFAVEHYGTMMGLIPHKFDEQWTVELLPGNFMAFYEPWDSGLYDT